MRSSLWLLGVALAAGVGAVQIDSSRYAKRDTQSTGPPLPKVATYNFSMPVDHFDASNNATYSNRFFVNDTYYKAGGPVILFDAGEQEITDSFAGEFLAEYNGTVSAPIRLAAELHGLVIAWEHRYYGYSQPVKMNVTSGTPAAGATGYKYLTIEQGLEDLVYFANHFNKTILSQNTINSTARLDPYHTPWIHVGGSYTGARAAWARIRNPEVFYAAWASSAPVEEQTDGSVYFNPISRALPSNCTSDLYAISQWADQELASSNSSVAGLIKAGVYLMEPSQTSRSGLAAALKETSSEVAMLMLNNLVYGLSYQSYGPGQTLQVFCDYMESFDTNAYIKELDQLNSTADLYDLVLVGLNNPGQDTFYENGIVAADGQDGPMIGFAAFTWAFYNYQSYIANFTESMSYPPSSPYTNRLIDERSWTWQTLSEIGAFQYANTSTKFLSSKFITEQVFVSAQESNYKTFKPSDFPTTVAVDIPLAYGGWNMKPSNVMFTNGQYDPWRSLSVASIEDGSPQRAMTTTIPTCNASPHNTDVFGIVYPGAVHVEDLAIFPSFHQGSEESTKPLYQGLKLFTSAYAAWAPCFNASRDAVRNGGGYSRGNSTAFTATNTTSTHARVRSAKFRY